jgi:hypothetical protein
MAKQEKDQSEATTPKRVTHGTTSCGPNRGKKNAPTKPTSQESATKGEV